jgi:hypothetical protein
MELLVFNPEHDYALADNSPHFVALRSAAQFAFDCAPFMRYLSDGEGVVFDAYRPEGEDFRKVFEPLADAGRITKVTPWGWDAAVTYQLRRIGIPDSLLPTEAQLSKLRELAHRKTTIAAMEFLRERHPHPETLPEAPVLLTTGQDIIDFVKRVSDAIFKSPYSGNGRGHLYAHGECTPTLLRQCTGVLKRQGGILAEKQYAVVQDFAMEFDCSGGKVSFRGYSLFQTVHYGYAGNLLMPDDSILSFLSQYSGIQDILQVQTLVIEFLEQNIAPYYDGEAGVDMFVYQEDGMYKLHPFVEVNLRKTMGLAAHDIFARCCHPEARGTFRIVHGSVETHHGTSLQTKMQCRDGLWYSGRAVLNPVVETTRYAVVVELTEMK